MRKFLFGLPTALLLANGAWGACGDTTFTVTGNPYNPLALINHIQNCDDSSMVLTLKNGMGTGLDTVRLTTKIIIASRPAGNSVVTHIRGEGRTTGSSLIVTENTGATDPSLFDFQAGNRGILQNFTIVRKLDNNGSHSVNIAAKGTVVRDCHFFRSDNSSTTTTGALLSVTADSILVERCLFRAPPNGKGRAIAITTTSNATRNEYRSNIFYSTGLYLVGGSFHIFANTFAGSRDDYNAIIVGQNLTASNTTDKAVNIQHNLFALKADTLPPIVFSSTVLTASDSIQKNAWSRSRPTLPLAVNGSNAALTLNFASAGNANVVLPRGFSRYAPHVADFKEYPMATLRADETLPRAHAEFGEMPRVYDNSLTNWTIISDVSGGIPTSKLYFAGSNAFTPFIQGKTWRTGIKVGALVDAESRITPPSPLDSGALGKGLTITRHPTDSTRMRVTTIAYNAAYYDTLIRFSQVLFFFSNSQLSANDSTALKAATPYFSRVNLADFDSNLTVPKEVRTGNPIFVKMLHYNAGGQAAVLSSTGVTAQVTGIPSFPINDLGVPAVDAAPLSDTGSGLFSIKVLKLGAEPIDSIRVNVQRVGGGIVDSKSRPAPAMGGSATFSFQLVKGSFQFTAVPVAKVGAVYQTGAPTAPSRAYNSLQVTGDTVFVINRTDTTGCGGKAGYPEGSAFCNLDDAMDWIATKNGGAIVVKNGPTPVPFQGITIGASGAGDSSAVTITVPTLNGAFDPAHRAAFRGSLGKEALNISRKNVTIRGFYIEMPAGATGTALAVQSGATGVSVDGCVFRPITNAPATGPAISIGTGGNGDMRFINNLVWGFASAVRIASTSTNVRILHNTFVEEPAHASPATGIAVQAASSGAVIANNYFSGITNPYDVSVAGKAIMLDHNGYPTRIPELRGLTELGTVDSIPRLSSLNLISATWKDDFRLAMESITNCDAIKECFELYAGSSANSYGPAITSDVLGRPRLGKPELGALEADVSTTGVRGVLIMGVRTLEEGAKDADDRLVFTVTSRTYDPADSESLYVWWSASPGTALSDSIPAANQRKYHISRLNSGGTLTDTAKGLDANRTYHFAASLGRNPTKTPDGRTLGFAYRDTETTPITLTEEDCKLERTDSPVCPQSGLFVSPSSSIFQTKVTFSEADSGGVKVPVFRSLDKRQYGKVEMATFMPVIRLSLAAAKTDVPGSKQSWTATIRLPEGLDELFEQSELFILPADSGGLPTYVSTWKVEKDGNVSQLIIEGTESGTFDFAFGNLIGDPGTVAVVDGEPPVFSFITTTGDSASVSLKITGSGFATQNPLILVTPIPAGTIYPNPMGRTYPNRTLVISSGLSDLEDDLRLDRFYRYYHQAVSVDSNEALSPVTPGTRKPFSLTPLTTKSFSENTILTTPQVLITGSGDIVETELKVPIWRDYANGQLSDFPDKKYAMTRSIEAVFTVFDGAKISRSSGYIRTEFKVVQTTEVNEFSDNIWNLHAYPWDELYNDSLARIFNKDAWSKDDLKLMKYKGSGNGSSDFLHYDGADASGITFDSGQAVWTGSRSSYKPRSGGGKSLDFQTFKMTLKPNVWNDFGLPFNFTMKWADILRASGLVHTTFKVWRYSPPTSKSGATFGSSLDPNSVILPWQGLTVKPTTETILQFPVIDSSRSTTQLAKKASSASIWSATIRAYNPTASMSLRIGKGASENVTSEAPDVPGQDFRVGLKRMQPGGVETLSEFIQSGEDWRGHWSLSGRASKHGIRIAVEENRGKTPLYLVELLGRRTVALAPDAEVAISGEELQNGDYHLVAGDSRYLQDILDGLVPMHLLDLANFPNPFSGSTLIRYALPESFGKVVFRMKVRDSRGRLVWEKAVSGSNSLRYLWDGRDNRGKAVGAGFYTLSLEAVTPGKATQRATRRMLKF